MAGASSIVCFIVWLETIMFINHTICKCMEWNDTNEHDEYSIDDRLQPSPKEDALLDTETPVILTILHLVLQQPPALISVLLSNTQ